MTNIRNQEYLNQIYDYSNLRFGNITPTDIDGMIEYKNLCYVYFEIKYNNTEPPFGQRLALERQCDDMQKVKPVITIIASHNIPLPGIVDVANTTVSEYRFRGKWHRPDNAITTLSLVTRFINWVDHEKWLGDNHG